MDEYTTLMYHEKEHYKRIKVLNENLIEVLRARVSSLEFENKLVQDRLNEYEKEITK